jgi:hypothetical protein
VSPYYWTALMPGWIEASIEAGIRFAEGGDAHVKMRSSPRLHPP